MVKKKLKRSRPGTAAGLGLFFGALVLGALAQLLVRQEVPTLLRQLPGWALFITGGFLLFLGWRKAKPEPLTASLPFKFEAAALLLIVLFSAWMRLAGLKASPHCTNGRRLPVISDNVPN